MYSQAYSTTAQLVHEFVKLSLCLSASIVVLDVAAVVFH